LIEDCKNGISPLALIQNNDDDLVKEIYESFKHIKDDKYICSKHYMLIERIKTIIEDSDLLFNEK
jgi:hypothetical protein